MKSKRWYSPKIATNLHRCYARASATDRAEGLAWYENAHEVAVQLGARYGVTTRDACGVLAALSPGRQWGMNVQDADTFLDEWSHGARGKRLPLVGSYGWRNILKAAKCASGIDPMEVLGGFKVRAFYACMFNPQSVDVCIDRHAKSVALGYKLPESQAVVRDARSTPAPISSGVLGSVETARRSTRTARFI